MQITVARFILILWIVGLVGCATANTNVSYDASDNQTTYESRTVNVAQMDAAIGSGSAIVMQAVASCKSRECTPEQARLVFSVQGQGRVALADRSISIVADKIQYAHRSESEWNTRDDISFSDEQVVEVELSLSALEQIANASMVSARLGGTPLNFGSGVRGQLQTFVQTARNQGANSSG